ATTSSTAPSAAPATDISTPPAESAEAIAAPGPRIYLVTRIKLSGTDLTQVVFFQHPAMSDMEACEAERNRGLMNQWNYFGRYYLKTLKGVSYKVDYRCVESETRLAYWRQGNPNSISYLVRTGDNKLKVSDHRNFFECRDALRAVAKEESVDNFCAVSSQVVIPELPAEEQPASTQTPQG
ncbi:MAG: hypothetical protein REI12_13695, partial [Pedobacter sp.]|nr:hypothetical protein [Pedobacter sp.]